MISVPNLLAAIAYQLRFTPTAALVLVGIVDGAVDVIARVDAGDVADSDVVARSMDHLGHVERLALVAYTADEDSARVVLDAAMLADARLLGAEVAARVWAGQSAYRLLTEGAQVRPMSEVWSSPVAAALTAAGVPAPAVSREALWEQFAKAGEAERRAATEAGNRWEAAHQDCGDAEVAKEVLALVDRARGTVDAAALGVIGAALVRKRVRDRVVAYLISGRWPATDGEVEQAMGITPGERSGEIAQGAAILDRVAAHTTGPWAAHALAAAAAVKWYLGNTAEAQVRVEAAQREQPGNRLAGLIAEMVHLGVPPLWVKH